MEKSWNIWCVCLGLLLCQLCNGLPINLANTAADSHTQLLTGLVAVLLTVCSVVFLAGCLCCRHKNGFQEFRDSPVVVSTSSNSDHGHVNPVANGEFTIFTPLSPLHQHNNVFLASQQIVTRTEEDYGYGDVDVSSWFNGEDNDFPRNKLKYIREIGKGWFGRVVEGAAQYTNTDQQWSPVVVRILEATASSKERAVFLHDATIYRCGTHPNILGLIGKCLDTIPLLLLQEYCPQGDLKHYLKQNKANTDKFLSTEYPLVWCCQLTSAIKHLHDNKLIHPDLAARNCQLTSDLTLKLGDYGLAVFQYPDDYYQGVPGVSVRWCAPESLSYTSTTIQPNKLTIESNIWSLGVTMWEICECGQQPYSELTDDEVISQVLDAKKVRLPRPKFQMLYTDYIFRLMQLCWTNRESRPSVVQIDLMLNDLLQVYKNTKTTQIESTSTVSVENFDKRWDSFKPNNIIKTDNHIVETTPSTTTDIDLDNEMVSSKPLSPSLNNLHGSLDNLLTDNDVQMESWLENVATKTGDMSYVQGLSDAIKDLDNALALENTSSSDSSHQQSPGPEYVKNKPKIQFKLGPTNDNHHHNDKIQICDQLVNNQNDSLTDSMLYVQRTSSESEETEEENWKTKIERGAYTEKVRQKSRSVTDLMVLTHIDHSESESETPLPSLDYRMNYKNVRYAPKHLENVSLMFGSEGNLLNVEDDFEEELKKLQEERRDSILFVPENNSQNNNNTNIADNTINDNNIEDTLANSNYVDDSPSRRLLHELNDTSEIKPGNQVFNVFNVTIDKFSPVHLPKTIKLNEIIHFNVDDCQVNDEIKQIPKLSEIAEYSLINNSNLIKMDNQNVSDSLPNIVVGPTKIYNVPKLVDLIQDNDDLMDYIIAKYENETINNAVPEANLHESNNKRLINETEHFLLKEIENYNDSRTNNTTDMAIDFDLSENQEKIIPNSLTHSNLFNQNSSLQDIVVATTKLSDQNEFLSLNLFCDTEKQIEDAVAAGVADAHPDDDDNNLGLYSLETWDNFLQKTLNNQNGDDDDNEENGFFDSFSSEPQSLLFVENNNETHGDVVTDAINKTFICDQDNKNSTFAFNDSNIDINDIRLDMETNEGDADSWENNGGWFLHSQSQNDDVSGEMVISPNSDSYVGFNVDDEIMAAIRTELLNKLPQAQGVSTAPVQDDDEEWESSERNEFILHYNVYNTPLSPIPEESQIDDNTDDEFDESLENTPRKQHQSEDDEVNSDWSEHEQEEILPHDTESHTPQTQESPARGHLHRHTPSQDSCCSNDTLFNLEELTCATSDNITKNESQNNEELIVVKMADSMSHPNTNNESTVIETTVLSNVIAPFEETPCDSKVDTIDNKEEIEIKILTISDKNFITEFIMKEREFYIKVDEPLEESNSDESTTTTTENLLLFSKNQVAPLPSPEDKPWKQLAQSLLSNNKILPNPHSNNEQEETIEALYENIDDDDGDDNVEIYETLEPTDIYNEADYVNIVNLENTKNSAEFSNKTSSNNIIEDDIDNDDDDDEIDDSPEYVNSFNGKNSIITSDNDEDTFRILTDIRFSGPSDNQMMTTSFSESNDLNDEQDWDSGSDTRSSSSGEFIWKEGEHEESLKALRAAPQDMLDDLKPMGNLQAETSSDSSSSGSGSEEDDEEEGESPEFVPSAWDKYATPTKSALRSPEKTVEKSEKKKSRGVWFKKQKYHCVYEYPREPESPILHSYDLWKPQDYSTFTDWDLDLSESNIQTKDDSELDRSVYQPKYSRNPNLYQLSSVPDFMSSNNTDDEFFITSSSKPFDKMNSSTSQFFPGNWTNLIKQNDNITPDSGVEDITTPGAINDSNLTNNKIFNISKLRNVPSLKVLASDAINKTKKNDETRNNDVLGGLRHTRNKLKLDLPPSPSAFTSSKMFTIEPIMDPVVDRVTPTFTTFGKSRFLVQHVDTPPDEITTQKNVSFEALPYKPLLQQQNHDDDHDDDNCDLIIEQSNKGKIEIVRGEASLLDSADEDSGIESSTLERKLNMIEAEN